MKKILVIMATVFFSGLLAGCGPVYQTTYSYVMPKGKEARQCIRECLSQKQACNLQCDKQKKKCQARNQQSELLSDLVNMKARREEARHYHKHGKHHHRHYSRYPYSSYSRVSCDTECGCDANYRVCYTSCGGQVIPHTVCVAGCKKGAE